MTTAAITTVNNSFSIELPPEVIEHLKVSSGDKLRLVETPTGVELQRITPEETEQLAAFEQVMREDDYALRRLAE